MEIVNFNDMISELEDNIKKIVEFKRNTQVLPIFIRESIVILDELLKITRENHRESIYTDLDIDYAFPEELEKKDFEVQKRYMQQKMEAIKNKKHEENELFEKQISKPPESPASDASDRAVPIGDRKYRASLGPHTNKTVSSSCRIRRGFRSLK